MAVFFIAGYIWVYSFAKAPSHDRIICDTMIFSKYRLLPDPAAFTRFRAEKLSHNAEAAEEANTVSF